MKYLDSYLNRIVNRGNPELAASVRKTAEKIEKEQLQKFDYLSSTIGLLFGNVQSGKTAQMFGILCTAADLGFPVFIILTTDNVRLQEQTVERVREDLPEFCICSENDGQKYLENSLVLPTVIVLKKNGRVLKDWANILKSSGFLLGNPLFVFDDEADAASLNTMVNQNRVSSINRSLDRIRADAGSCFYLQVTGTPQANLLQSTVDGWKPQFVCSFQPGKGYLGGDFFFPVDGIPKCISLIDGKDNKIQEAVMHHLACSALYQASGKKACTALFHPGVRVSDHEKTALQIQKILSTVKDTDWKKNMEELKVLYESLHPEKIHKCSFEAFFNSFIQLLNDNLVEVLLMNGSSDIENKDFQTGFRIVVGGNSLGRGVTFPSLHTIHYTRTAKKPQADTMWQHSRMFGYDRDPGLIQVYMNSGLYKLFSDINQVNNALIAMMEQAEPDIAFCFPEGLKPTRANVIDQKNTALLAGGTSYYPADPENKSFNEIARVLERFDETVEPYSVSLRIFKTLLKNMIPSEDFDQSMIESVIDSMIASNPGAQGRLLVRRNRKVHQGTGALISSQDSRIIKAVHDFPVLVMYQIEPGYGWKQNPIWVPNIKFPDGKVYIKSDV